MSDKFEKHPDYPHGTPDYPFRKVFGYARVSTDDQDMSMQIEKLENFGCDKIFQEKKSAAANRPQFNAMLKSMRAGDTIVVWKLDRMSRSVQELASLMKRMQESDIDLKSLTQNIDTSDPMGKLAFYMTAVFAEMERDMISERTKAGIALRKAEGVQFGKPTKVKGHKKLRILLDIWALKEPLPKIGKRYGYKSHAIFQKYFPNERKLAFAARADGEDAYQKAMCLRVKEISEEQGIKPHHVKEILKEWGVNCYDRG